MWKAETHTHTREGERERKESLVFQFPSKWTWVGQATTAGRNPVLFSHVTKAVGPKD